MKSIKSFEDYLQHTRNHIERVLLLSLFIYRNNQKYKDLNIKLVYDYIVNHDKGKTDKFLKIMYTYYGKDKDDNFRDIVDQLNTYDKEISVKFFIDNKVNEKDKKLILEIEKIADCIDRNLHYLSPEEFCVSRMADISNYLSEDELDLGHDAFHYYRDIVRLYY